MTEQQQHPITPPPKLVWQWHDEWMDSDESGVFMEKLAIQAARWGADQQLDKCLQLLDINGCPSKWIDMLRAARRPKKPPSLKEQALTQLDSLHDDLKAHGLGTNTDIIRCALEQLDD